MDTMERELLERISASWKLDNNAGGLLAKAFRAVAMDCNALNISKTVGIIMAYNTVGLISDVARYSAIDMLEDISRMRRKGDAIYAIRAFFRPKSETMDIRAKLALKDTIDQRNAERIAAELKPQTIDKAFQP